LVTDLGRNIELNTDICGVWGLGIKTCLLRRLVKYLNLLLPGFQIYKNSRIIKSSASKIYIFHASQYLPIIFNTVDMIYPVHDILERLIKSFESGDIRRSDAKMLLRS
jgi:hypothetical protein